MNAHDAVRRLFVSLLATVFVLGLSQVASAAVPSVGEVLRFGGSDRFSTSVAISQSYAAGVGVVYVASGEDFPDALAAAPAAARAGGPLLITPKGSLPVVVSNELKRLSPKQIVVVGGEGAVSASVMNALKPLAGSGGVRRVSGADRFSTGEAIVRDAWAAGSATTVFVATGNDFPDALSAAAAAGAEGMPVITVEGKASTLNTKTASLVSYLGAKNVIIAGGTGAVSAGIEAGLKKVAGVTSVTRYAGSDRYATSTAVNVGQFPVASTAFIATGNSFPDALSGAARAGADGAPLYVIPGDCIPQNALDAMAASGVTTLTALGGTGVVSITTGNIRSCGSSTSPGGGGVSPSTAYAQAVLDLVNVERADRHLPPLTLNSALNVAAGRHSVWMASTNTFSHTGQGGSAPWDRMDDAGYNWCVAGENIAAGYTSASDVVAGWMDSEGHRENILDPDFTEMGLATAFHAQSDYGIYWTQVFGSRCG